MSQDSLDVVVVGGGPAGAIAAYSIAKAGLSVALIEKEKLPRYKTCGGVVATHVDKILDFSIEPVIERKISKILITVKLSDPFIAEAPYPFIYLVMRDKFDNFLVEKAALAGAKIYPETPLLKFTENSDGYLIHTPKQDFQTKYIIAADGANSITRKLAGAPRFKNVSVAVERELLVDSKTLDTWHDTIALDFGYLSSGYAWVFPKAENFSIGTGGPRSVSKQLVPYYEDTIKFYKNKLGEIKPYLSEGHHLPIRSKGEKIQYGRILFVGDAAGMIEPMAGEGIYYAIRSGQLAAETIIESIQIGDEHLKLYETKIDKEIQPELQVARSLLYMLDLAPSFWVPRLMQSNHIFWKYFYRIFTGEKEYQDVQRKFGIVGKLFFGYLERKLDKHKAG